MRTTDFEELEHRYRSAGQCHVFAYWEELDSTARAKLAEEASEIDLEEVNRLSQTLVRNPGHAHVDLTDLQPAPYIALPEHGGHAGDWAEARLIGEQALRDGRVAAFTVAGGQGTRLGYPGPKGTFPVTPLRKKPLFQIFAEKLRAAGRAYTRDIPWLIMTSHANHAETLDFFAQNQFFGLRETDVFFFRQGRMPAVDFHGKILMSGRDSIALSPDGHGGSLRALERSGALHYLEQKGIDCISYFQVDNPLVKVVDPYFLGFHLRAGSEMSSKMIPKAYAGEKVGHFCHQNGKLVVIEYSDMPVALAGETDANGRLRFIAGSIAIHLLDLSFARRVGSGQADLVLPFHRADKKIPCLSPDGTLLDPKSPNGIKFEMFVFDALPFAHNPVVIETRREEEFSPVKNATGVDSAETCRRDQVKLFARWLGLAGVPVPLSGDGIPAVDVEISPLFGYDEDSFMESWQKLTNPPRVENGLYLTTSDGENYPTDGQNSGS